MTNLEHWLADLGLAQYAETFKHNDVDLDVLPHLREDDLKELGLSLGHRRKLLSAIAEQFAGDGSVARAPLAPRSVVSHQDAAPQAERRQLTVMFCDLVESTTLVRQMDSEEYRDMLLAYQDVCRQVVKRFDGYIARYMGDGILVYFGYPKAHEDDAERAVRAGLDLIHSIELLRGDFRRSDDIALAVRVGIATGPVLVDFIGERGSQESAALGETPHLAARLQALAAPNNLVISAATRKLLGGLFSYEDLGSRALKGFPTPVNAWKVTRQIPVESRFDAIHAQLTPLVGREEELNTLSRYWDRAAHGHGQAVFISGDAGIGKSRLIQAFCERLSTERYTILRYQCSPYYTNSALYPIVEQLERAAGFSRNDAPEKKLPKLEKLLARSGDDVQVSAPLLAALLSIPSETRYGRPKLTPQQQKQKTLKALREHVFALAENQTLLLIVEDVHWIDPTTRELLDSILLGVERKPILTLLTARPELQSSWDGDARVTTLTLPKLDPEESRAMLQNVMAGKTLPWSVHDQILEKTDGVPLFVEELTRTVLDSGILKEETDRYVLDTPLARLTIPTTLHDSLMARLDRLTSVKDVAQIAAVIGREFSYELLRAVANLPEAELDRTLDKLIDAGLIFKRGIPSDANYTFKHALIQDTAYQSLVKSRRQQLHASIAQALEERFPSIVETQPELAAYHLSEAGLVERAIECWHKAGKNASRRSADAEASHHFAAGIAALEKLSPSESNRRRKLDLLVDSMAPVSAVKGYSAPEFERLYREALSISRVLGDTPQIFPVLYARWLVAYVGGQLPQALEAAHQFLNLAKAQKAEMPAAVAQRCVGTVLSMNGDPVKACQYFQQVIDRMDESASSTLGYTYGQDTLVAVRSNYALALCTSGYPDQAHTCLRLALARAKQLNHAQTLLFGHTVAGCLHAFLRETDELASHVDAITSIVEEQPMALWAQAPRFLLGYRALFERRYETSRDLLEEIITATDSLNYYLWRPAILRHLAEAYLGLGDCQNATRCVDQAFDEIRLGRDSWYEPDLHRIRGRILQMRGEAPEIVEACFQEAISVAIAQSAKLFELRAANELARFWMDRGKAREACTLLEPLYGWFREGFDTADLRTARDTLKALTQSATG